MPPVCIIAVLAVFIDTGNPAVDKDIVLSLEVVQHGRNNLPGVRRSLCSIGKVKSPDTCHCRIIRGQKVFRAKRFDYSLHSEYKKLKSSKAILHEPDWKTSRVSLPREQIPDAIPVAPAPAQKKQTDSVKQKPPSAVSEPILGRKSDLSEIL